ncbi:MAG TPA: SUMF1/EgtB/PvdO family nonheme iron enzyme, partial [Candidatus Hydrogenedentes bacterium]|nr:SUMF1/EgtB/PvdO family nonheme iron enzyme [Candidatus Hydrogenedentota bacterium]
WGLHDMHGNVWEWTRSLYRGYPYEEGGGRNARSAEGRRVVRGGSWYDRPKRATAAYRLAYAPWQRVFNVGFRVICVDKDATVRTVTLRGEIE